MVVKELGGWGSMQMVERYTHLAPLAAQELAKHIEAIIQPRFPVSWAELVHA